MKSTDLGHTVQIQTVRLWVCTVWGHGKGLHKACHSPFSALCHAGQDKILHPDSRDKTTNVCLSASKQIH